MVLFQTLLTTTPPTLLEINQVNILEGIFKVLFILSVVFYIVFAVIVIRQVQIMKNTLITPISPLIMFFSVVHLLLAAGVLFLFFIIL